MQHMTFLDAEQAKGALMAAGITGPHQSHSRRNVIGNIRALVAGDPDKLFGMSAPVDYTAADVLGFLADVTGCLPDIGDEEGWDTVDPERTMAAIMAAARRLADSAARGDSLMIATGHPTGLLEHHIRIAEVYQRAGGKLIRPAEDRRLPLGKGRSEVVYTCGVGCLADGASLRHTHAPDAMEAVLESDPWPDIVFADHGFAGAAIQREIPTVAVMDINDPALAVAHAESRDAIVIPMDDNRLPRLYEPSWRVFELALGAAEL
jgi:Phosphatase